MVTCKVVFDTDFDVKPFEKYDLVLYDMRTRLGQKNGYKLKSQWSARLNPFVLLEENNKPIKAFYSEEYRKGSAIKQLEKYDSNTSNA